MSDVHPSQQQELAPLDEPADAELISAVRGGELDAYGKLFERHVDSARRLARQLVSSGDVDDLVSDAFAKVLAVLQRGGGPDLAFRAYLLTSLRRLHVDRLRANARLTTTDDLTPYDPGVPFDDTAVSGFDNAAAAKAFASLPERWQQVLWHTEVEGQKPAEIAPLLGISANSVSALAYRAREGLREAFISMHAQEAVEDDCAATRAHLGAYLRGGISRRDAAKVEDHLGTCRECSGIYLELSEVNNDLGAVLAPLVLGSAGAGYLAAAHAGAIVAAKGGLLLFLGRTRDWTLHHPAGRTTAAACGAVLAGVVIAAVASAHGGSTPTAARHQPSDKPAAVSAAPPAPPAPAASAAAKKPPAAGASTPVPPAPWPRLVPAAPTAPTSPRSAQQPSTDPVIRRPLAEITAVAGGSPVTIDLTKGAVDPRGRPLSVQSAEVAVPSHGTVTINDGSAQPVTGRRLVDMVTDPARRAADATTVTYTPAPGWRGVDTIHYVLTNGDGGTAAGSVKVSTPNTAPVARADFARAVGVWFGGTPTRIDVLANDSDANGDPLSIDSVTVPGHGSVAISGSTINYTPSDGYVGADSFAYTISDGHGGAATGTVGVSVGVLPNRPPVAHDVTTSAAYGTPVTVDLHASVIDPDGDDLAFAVGTKPAHGEVTVSSDGTAVYTPAPGFDGPDSFGYTVSDGHGGSDSGVVSVTVRQPVGNLSLTSKQGSTSGYPGSHGVVDLVIDGIPAGRHATVTITVLGFTGSQNDAAGVCDADWKVEGTTATQTCSVDSADDGKQLGHYDPGALGMSARATADDFISPDAEWVYP